MEERVQKDKPLRDLIEIMQFTEKVSAKIHGLLDEAEIYRTVKEEFARSKRYTASILLLTEDGSKLRVAEVAVPPGKVKAAEKVTGVPQKQYKIDLNKSSIYSQVVREGKTIQVNTSEIIGELFPRPVAYLITKTIGYEKSPFIATPLKRRGKIIGVLGISSTSLTEHFIPSVRNLAQHISTALELVDEHAERKKAEEELVRLSGAVKMSTDSIVISDLDAKIIDVNEATLKMYGTDDKGGLIGKNSFDLIVPEERERALAGMEEVLEKGYVKGREYRIITKDGGRIPVEMSVAIMKDADGKPIGFVGISRDITERKKAQEELQKSEERYRLLFNSGNDAVFVHREMPEGMPGKFVEVNGAACQMLGYTREELLKLSPLNIVAPEDLDVFSKHKEKFYAEEGIRLEMLLVTKNGRKISVEVTGHLFDLKGQLVVLTIARDITERKQAEEALRDSEKSWSDSFNALEDVMIIINEDYTIEKINDNGLKLLGKTREEVIGKKCYQVVHGTDAPCEFCSFKRTLKTGKVESVDKYMESFDKYFSIKSSPIFNEHGEIVRFVDLMRDITNRKKIEEKFRESEERFRNLYESIQDPVGVYVGREGRLIEYNEAFKRTSGYTDEELKDKIFLDFVHPDDQAMVLEKYRTKYPGEELPLVYELRGMTKKGVIPIEISVSTYKKKGKVVGIEVIHRDITERKKAQEEIEAGRKKLGDIIDTMADSVCITDLNANITMVNKVMEDLFEMSKEKLLTMNGLDLITKEDIAKVSKTMQDLIKTGLFQNAEVTGRLGGAKGRPFWMRFSLLKDRKGEPAGIITVTRDITERKQMEEKLRQYSEHLEEIVQKRTEELLESEKRYSVLVEEASDGVAIAQDGKIAFANKRLLEIGGYSRDDFIGLPFVEVVDEKYLQRAVEDYERRMRGEKVSTTLELELVSKTGERVPIEASSTLIHYQGRPATLTLVRDIRERKQMEEERLKLEKLATIGELATMVGHDLRNPLQSIENATYYLNNELPRLPPSTQIPQKAIEMLQVINDSVNYADKIIRDLHAFSATKKPILKKTHINAIIKETLSQAKAPENVKLITKLGHLPKIKADKDMIKRAFLNLATNGIQAMKEKGGTLKVSTKKTKGFVEVSFKDTGTGISKQNMKKLFTPFFTTRAKGMGMGLPVCKKFVEIHGGTIHVESEEGKGTTFTVKLPIQQ